VSSAPVLSSSCYVSHRYLHSFPTRRSSDLGLRAFWGAAATGALLGVAALLSYGAAWFAVSLLCLYFVRRRPWHILGSAASALGVLAFAATFGAPWPAGLVDTYDAAVGEGSEEHTPELQSR